MSSRTRAQMPAAGGGVGFQRIIIPYFDNTFTTTMASVANRAFATYIELKHGGTITKLGVKVNLRVNGNIQVGLYDSNFNRICVTAVTPVAGLAAYWNWLATTTNPTIDAGYYWVAVVCDSNYAAGVSGVQFNMGTATEPDLIDSADLGNQMMVRMDAAYPLPDPFVPVNNDNTRFAALGVEM